MRNAFFSCSAWHETQPMLPRPTHPNMGFYQNANQGGPQPEVFLEIAILEVPLGGTLLRKEPPVMCTYIHIDIYTYIYRCIYIYTHTPKYTYTEILLPGFPDFSKPRMRAESGKFH